MLIVTSLSKLMHDKKMKKFEEAFDAEIEHVCMQLALCDISCNEEDTEDTEHLRNYIFEKGEEYTEFFSKMSKEELEDYAHKKFLAKLRMK